MCTYTLRSKWQGEKPSGPDIFNHASNVGKGARGKGNRRDEVVEANAEKKLKGKSDRTAIIVTIIGR